MPDQYLVHLPDGTEYGPVDRSALAAWRDEGRLPPDTLVWPHGAPDWLTVEAALGVAAPVAAEEEPTLARVLDEPVPKQEARVSAPVAVAARPAPAAHTAPAPTRPMPAMARPASTSARPAGSSKPAGPTPAGASHAPAAARPVPASPAPAVGSGAARGDEGTETKPPRPAPALARRPQARQRGFDMRSLRPLLLTGLGLALVAAALAGLWALLRPYVARRWAIAAVQRYATPERRLEDRELGLVAELPTGWVALRPENPFVREKQARLRLAQPSLAAFATVTAASRPRFMDVPDAYLDELLLERIPRQPSVAQQGRTHVQLGRGQGRLVRTTWQDGLTPMLGATVAWADGYSLLAVEAWAPAEAGAEFQAQFEALCRGLRTSGLLEARVNEAVERVALEVPELPRDSLRLLVAEHLSRGPGLERVPTDALRLVSRGLEALAPAEAAEMRAIYQQIWDPVPEEERLHLASLMDAIKTGREVPGGDIQPLRDSVKAGVLALPAEQQARLQELSGRALRKALASQ
jgi:hypothetical protein